MTRSPDVCLRVGSIAVNVDMCRNRGDEGVRRDTELAADAGRHRGRRDHTHQPAQPTRARPFVALKEAINVKCTRPSVVISLLATGAMVLSACTNSHATLSYASGAQGGVRRQEGFSRQRLDRASPRDDQVHRRLPQGLFRPDAQLHRQRLGCRNQRIPRRQDRFRRIGHTTVRRPIRGRQAAMRWCRRLEPARGIRSAGHHLQPRRRRHLGARRTHAGQDLQRHHHPLGRPGPHRAQRVHAVRGHPCDLPQRRIGHHRQLPVLPTGRIWRSLEHRAPARCSTAASAPAPQATKAPRRS